jgi:cytochrome b
MTAAVTFALVVKALHVIAAFAAFGLPFAYPALIPYVRRHHPEALAGVHDAQHRFSVWLTGPGTVTLLAAGIYLASKHDQWGQLYVQVGLAAIVVIALAGGLITRDTARLATLARDDLGGAEYERVYRRYLTTETALGALVLVVIFLMVVKP